jgi:hypothetical protein
MRIGAFTRFMLTEFYEKLVENGVSTGPWPPTRPSAQPQGSGRLHAWREFPAPERAWPMNPRGRSAFLIVNARVFISCARARRWRNGRR